MHEKTTTKLIAPIMSHFASATFVNEFGNINFSQLYALLPGLPSALQSRQDLPAGWKILLGGNREIWAVYDSANRVAFTTSGPTYIRDENFHIMDNWDNGLPCGDTASMFGLDPMRLPSVPEDSLSTMMASQPDPSYLVPERVGGGYVNYDCHHPSSTPGVPQSIYSDSQAQFFNQIHHPFTFVDRSHTTQDAMSHNCPWINRPDVYGPSDFRHQHHHWNHTEFPPPHVDGSKRFKSEHCSISPPPQPPAPAPVLSRIIATTAKLQATLHALNSRPALSPSELSRTLPIELCLEIMCIGAQTHGRQAIKTMSLVCRDWRHMAQIFLFRCLSIGQIAEEHQYIVRSSVSCKNLSLLAAIPRLANQVKTIVLGGCRSQEKTRFACLSNRRFFPNLRHFVLTKGAFTQMAYHRLPHVEALDIRIPMTQPSKHLAHVQFRPSSLKEVTIHTHEGMLARILEDIARSPSADILTKADIATVLYSLGSTPSIGLHISRLSALTELRLNVSLAQKFIGHLSDTRLLVHPTLARLSLDLPSARGSYHSEDILRAVFGGADVPRLRHLSVIAQTSSFKRSDSGWQIAFWHKSPRSRRDHRAILPKELGAQLLSLRVIPESPQSRLMGNMEHSVVIIEDTHLIDLLQEGGTEGVFRVEHATGARIMYPDEAFVLGFTGAPPALHTRKRKAH